jgi:hypothetical protein
LTQFKDVAPQLTEIVPTSINRPVANPYLDVHQELLTREYALDLFNWGITPIAKTYAFPDYLITNAALWPIMLPLLSLYRYYSADIEIRIKMETTPFHQGALLVSSMPGGPALLPNLTTASGLNACVLCASEQNECKLTIPYLAPQDWIDGFTSNLAGTDSSIGRLWIKTLNTLIPTQANMPTSVPVIVYWRFKNIKQKSPISGVTVLPKDRIFVEAHSNMKPRHNTEASAKHKNGLDTHSAVSMASAMIKEIPVVGNIYAGVASVLKSIAPDLSKPTAQVAPVPMSMLYGHQTAVTEGLDYSQETSMYPNAQVTQSPTFYGMESSHMPVSSLAQKPMLHDTPILTNASPDFFTFCTPLYFKNSINQSDWLYNVAYAFRYWRGSIKYFLHFCVPSFYAFRVLVTLEDQNAVAAPQSGDVLSKVIDIKGNTCVTFNVPYQRSTPWVSPRADRLFSGSYAPPVLRVLIITPIVGSTAPATPIVYLNVWRAGGEDTQFSSLMGARDGDDVMNVEAHMDMCQLFSIPFETLHPTQIQGLEKGLIQCDVAGTVSDCLKRPANHTSSTTTVFGGKSTVPGTFIPGASNINFSTFGREPFHYFSNMFLFWRGSRVLKHKQETDLFSLQGADGNQTYGDGLGHMFVTDPTGTPYLMHDESINVPYYCQVPYYPTWQGTQLFPPNFLTSPAGPITPLDLVPYPPPTTGAFQICGGDDLMLLYPAPFFPLVYYPPSTTLVPMLFKKQLASSTAEPSSFRKS